MRAVGLAVATVALLATVACGGEEKPPSDDPLGVSDMPSCADVWVAGETLPSDYEGCLEDGDNLIVVVTDSQGNTGYDDRFTAKPGGVIEEIR